MNINSKIIFTFIFILFLYNFCKKQRILVGGTKKTLTVLIYDCRDTTYMTNSEWFPNSEFENEITKFIFINDNKKIDKADIVLFPIANNYGDGSDINILINDLKKLKKQKNQSWFTLCSEVRFEFLTSEINILKQHGIDKFLYQSFNGDYPVIRGIAREYFGNKSKNYSYDMFFDNKPSFDKQKKKLCIIYSHEANFKRYSNKNIKYNFPYNSRGAYLLEIMNNFECDSYGKWNNNKPMIDNHSFDTSAWQNKINLIKNYMFCAALENNLDMQYPEKIFQALYAGTIPIISIKDDKKLLPPHSYISIRDFPNAIDLAKYLHKIANNQELYESYFTWKKNPELLKKTCPKFYQLVISSCTPCFLENLHFKNKFHKCTEYCMKQYNKYYNKYH